MDSLDLYEAPRVGDDSLSLEDIKRIQDRGKLDLYFFSRGILGYKDLTPRVHRELCDFMVAGGRRKLVLMPRSHFKTTVATIADTLREVCTDPNQRILLGNESGVNSESMLTEIKEHITNNPKLRAFYNYIIPKNINETTWAKNQILLPRSLVAREPTISTIGTGGAVVSRHFNLMKFDDLIGEEALHSPAVMKKAIDWLNHSVSLLITPAIDRIHLVGTRWAYNDLYAHAIEKMGFEVFRRKAVVLNEAGEVEPLFSPRFDMEFFASIIETDPQQWAAQYANDPSDTLFADFKKEWLRYYTVAPDGNLRFVDYEGMTHIVEFSKLRIYIHVDPSMGETLNADCSAVMVVGVDSSGRVFLLDAWEQRIDPINLTEKLFEVYERYSPKIMSIESTAFQKALRYFVENEAKRRGTYLRIEDFKPSNKKSKEARIRGALQPYFSTGSMFVRANQTHFIEAYMAFGRTDQDHMMDALAQGPQYWKTPHDDESLERHKRIAGRLMLPSRRGLSGYGI
jgi:predicted phage terminase large subunit-like protein